MLQRLDTIVLYKGATCEVELDLSDFTFNGGKVVFSMKDRNTNEKKTGFSYSIKGETGTVSEMTEPKIYTVNFPVTLTNSLTVSDGKYCYDIIHEIGERKYPQCALSPIVVKDTTLNAKGQEV